LFKNGKNPTENKTQPELSRPIVFAEHSINSIEISVSKCKSIYGKNFNFYAIEAKIFVMSDNNTVRRVRILRAALKKQGADGLIVTKAANVTYLTGFLGDDSWALITPKRTYLLTDSRYTEQAKKECIGCVIIERKEGLSKTAASILNKLPPVKSLFAEDNVQVATFSALQKNVKLRLHTVGDTIEKLREIKDKEEIKTIKKAADIAQRALAATMKYVKIGISENELAGILNLNIRRLGGRESFETIVAFGENGSRPHHLSGDRKLKKNDTVLIDWGARYKGYCSDLTRSFAVGKPSQLFKKVHSAVLEAQAAAIAKVKDGVLIAEVDSAAREVLKKHNLPIYGHGTGHGLGLEVHEKPIVSAKIKGKLRAGQVFTIEPGIYMPGVLGVRIEDDVLVTKGGYKILSSER
jgi:Xaa-Pro aminopeptidase